MTKSVPFNDLRAQYLALQPEIDAAVADVLTGGWYVLGAHVQAFESEFAAYCGAPDCVTVNSGTDALQLALRACGIGPGDEVITVAHTAVATVAAIRLTGATPVLVDIEPERYTMDPACLAAAIAPRTKAVIPVHLYGRIAAMPEILDIAHSANLYVIEDCAQAHGARLSATRGHDRPVGTMGDLGCFSFYPTKNLGAMGDGGAIIGSNSELMHRVRLLREYGWTPEARYVSQLEGLNSRLDEVQAAVLRVKLRYLDQWNRRRQEIACRYTKRLRHALRVPDACPTQEHVYHLYVARVAAREQFRAQLQARGVGTGIHYPVPVHHQPAYASLAGTSLPVTEAAARQIVSLPLHPFLSDEEVDYTIDTILAVLPVMAEQL